MEPLCYWNGSLLPASQLAIPPWDTGFVQGVTVAEQLRTFGGRLFQLEKHLERLHDSLCTLELDAAINLDGLGRIATELAAHNHRMLSAGDDLGLSLFITPGPYSSFAPPGNHGPTVGMHTYPIGFASFARKYKTGERLVVTNTRQVPANCWPAALKCRSRMHYYLADRAARRQDASARALLLDQTGMISEASTANFVLFRRPQGFLSPPREKILPGVSLAILEELAVQLQMPLRFQDLPLDDVWSADEAFLCSTSPCVLAVTAINGRPIGDGLPGPIFQRVMAAWNELAGLDIIAQAERFSDRSRG